MALGGDLTALKLCLERLIAPRKERPVNIKCQKTDLPDVMQEVIQSILSGDISPIDGEKIYRLIESFAGFKNKAAFNVFDIYENIFNSVDDDEDD